MTTEFKCPRCKNKFKIGRLHASTTCPNCKVSMLITKEEKMQGHLNYKRNFLLQK